MPPIKTEADVKDYETIKAELEAVANEGLPKPDIEFITA